MAADATQLPTRNILGPTPKHRPKPPHDPYIPTRPNISMNSRANHFTSKAEQKGSKTSMKVYVSKSPSPSPFYHPSPD